MFGFGRYDLSEARQDWLLDGLIWCAAQGILTMRTPMVLPTKEWFRAPSGLPPEATAEALLADILRIARMSDTAIDLMPIEVLPDALRHGYGQMSEVAGTWQSDGNRSLIRYDPTLLRRLPTFLSMMAHEVMHERLRGTRMDWPGGEELEELMTDLAAIASGFGVLQLAGAEDIGWQGYLRQDSRAHALALVLRATDIAPEAADAHLPARAAKALRRALRHVDTGQDVAELRAALPR
ncbi:MAG: hypothetical protein AAF919_01520 [Pseudomonadota bacterium]